MKKILSLSAAVLCTAAILSGCTKKPAGSSSTTGTQSSVSAEGTVKTGLAVISSIAKSKDVTGGTGLAEMDSTIVAVTVDKDGKIAKCIIDAVQTKVNFDAAGKITTPLNTVFKTKNELGAEYGMNKASGINKEWNEQAGAFAQYVVGKTSSEVAGIAVDDTKHPTGADLKSSVTISVGDFIAAVQKAVANAKDCGAKATDKLGLGVVSNIAKSKDAADSADGLAQAYTNYTVTTSDAQDKVTSCIIDASQTNVIFSKAGKITSDLNAVQKTKNELGDAYGMKKASGIGKEWYQEAAAFAQYVTGKSVTDINSIAVNESGEATSEDIKASVTVSIGDFKTIIEKAVSTAK